MAEKEYIIPYSNDVRKRHYHKTLKGRVEKFTVQLEIFYEGNWKEVVRYDCVHVLRIVILTICLGETRKKNCISALKTH